MSTWDEAIRRRSGIIDQIGSDATVAFKNRLARQAQQKQIADVQKQAAEYRAQAATRRQQAADLQRQYASYTGGGATPVGGGSNFDRFVQAIVGQESGGNYGAVNRHSGALGKYQIMPGNIASWSRAALGRSISPQQFLKTPQLQDQIARYQLQQYFNKWGPEGAAVAWYAGPGRVSSYLKGGGNKSQGSYPTIRQYAASIKRRMGL